MTELPQRKSKHHQEPLQTQKQNHCRQSPKEKAGLAAKTEIISLLSIL